MRAWGCASVAFGGASLIVPLYIVELGGDAFTLGVLFASASLVGVPGAILFGRLADRTGKRRAFVIGAMATATIALVAIPMLSSISLVVIANAVVWLSFAAALPILNLLAVTDEPEQRWSAVIARLNTFQGIGWTLGLAVGFLIIVGSAPFDTPLTSHRLVFLAYALSAGVGLVLGVRWLPSDPTLMHEPAPSRLRRAVQRAGRRNVRGAAFPITPLRFDPRSLHPSRLVRRLSPALSIFFGAAFIFFVGFGIFFAPLPAFLTRIGHTPGTIFGLYVILNVTAAAFFGHAAAAVARYSEVDVHLTGLWIRGIAFPLVPITAILLGSSLIAWGTTIALFALIGVTWALIAVTATTLVTRLAPAIIQGESLGFYGAIAAFGGGVGGMIGGVLATVSYTAAFLLSGAMVIMAGGMIHWSTRDSVGAIETGDPLPGSV